MRARAARARHAGARRVREAAVRTAARLRSAQGSAAVEFPLVAALILMVAVGVLQIALMVHTRNLLTDAAVQGAHHAARFGAEPADGAQRAEQVIAQNLGSSYRAAATAQQAPDGTITVRISATLPLVGLLGPTGALEATGRAIDEEAW